MYRLGTAELNGNLGLTRSPKEGVKWLKRSAEHATEEFPHALHELALLHERGIDNVLFVDHEYAAELLAQASELGYAPSAFKLGECYEYGKMDCPVDPALSIHYYVSGAAGLRFDQATADDAIRKVRIGVLIFPAEHRRHTRTPRRLVRAHGVVPRRLARRPAAIRHRGVPVGQESGRAGPGKGAIRRGVLHRGQWRYT
jgi:hypothetical protein